MGHIELNEKFIGALGERMPKRASLVAHIADTLRIERDSANRRLAGKVQFSIREMGMLARSLEISVDSLIYNDIPSCPELLVMDSPGLQMFPEERILEDIRQYAHVWDKVGGQPNSEYGMIVSSLPIQSYIDYPNTVKLSCFKWAYYMHNKKEPFSRCDVPKDLSVLIDEIRDYFVPMKYTFYIWDYSVLFGIISDIKYFHSMDLINEEEVAIIKSELADMLDNFEMSLVSNDYNNLAGLRSEEHYVSNVNMEVSASYIWSEEYYHSHIFTFFMRSASPCDRAKCSKTRDWINSMKKVSTLMSGSGELARVSFFRRQREYLSQL